MSDLNQNFVKPVPSLEQIQDALSGAKSLDDFFGKHGVVAKLVGPTLEHMMQAELTDHLGYKKHEVKVLYLVYQNAKKKWDKSITNWALIMNQLAIHFEGRFAV